MHNKAPFAETEVEDSDFKPLTAEEARRLRERHPALSPWWVIGAQVAAGLLVSLAAWAWTRRPEAAASAFYGALAVTLPAALFWRAVRRGPQQLSQSAAMLRFGVWELIKIVLTVALLAAAPRLIGGGLGWLALLAGAVAAMKVYWAVLVVRPEMLNRV